MSDGFLLAIGVAAALCAVIVAGGVFGAVAQWTGRIAL